MYIMVASRVLRRAPVTHLSCFYADFQGWANIWYTADHSHVLRSHVEGTSNRHWSGHYLLLCRSVSAWQSWDHCQWPGKQNHTQLCCLHWHRKADWGCSQESGGDEPHQHCFRYETFFSSSMHSWLWCFRILIVSFVVFQMPNVSLDVALMTPLSSQTWSTGRLQSLMRVHVPKSGWSTRARPRASTRRRSPPWCWLKWKRLQRPTWGRYAFIYVY